jgi:hypothetical protein
VLHRIVYIIYKMVKKIEVWYNFPVPYKGLRLTEMCAFRHLWLKHYYECVLFHVQSGVEHSSSSVNTVHAT